MRKGSDPTLELRRLRDAVRSGASLRQAILDVSDGATLGAVGESLSAGVPVEAALRRGAARASGEVRTALSVLALHAVRGGDPVPTLDALERYAADRVAAEREARSLTAQARLSARAVLLLTPAFLGLLTLADPGGMKRSMSVPGGRLAVVGGLVMQALGAWWIGRIVDAPLRRGSRRGSRVPVLRALVRLVGGAAPTDGAEGAAAAAEAIALAVGAGASVSEAVRLAASTADGPCAEALADAVTALSWTGPADALQRAATLEPALAPIAAAVSGAERYGVPLERSLRDLAADLRRDERSRVSEAVRASSIKVLVPLAVLVLPAFVLACLVPLFVSGMGAVAS